MTFDFIPVFGSPPPGAGLEGVWIWRCAPHDGGTSGLSPEEAARVSALVQPEQRVRLAAYLHDRKALLGILLDCPIGDVTIAHDPEGRPLLSGFPGSGLSLSDSQGWNALAFRRSGPVGIDLEVVRDIAWEPMLAMISEAEEAGLIRQAVSAARGPTPFFRCWTAKEAILKAAGTGMRGGPRRVLLPESFIQGGPEPVPIDYDGTNYRLDATTLGDVILARAVPA